MTTTDPTTGGQPSALRRRSVRTRMLGWVMLVAASGMLLAGAASYVVQRNLVDARIDASLAQEIAEFRTFAASGVDPTTARPFTSVQDLFYLALQRNVPDENEGFLTLVDSEPAYYTPGGTVRLQQHPQVLDAVAGLQPADGATIGTAATEIGDVRYAAVPVTIEGSPSTGVYVVGVARDVEQSEVADASRTYAVVAAVSLLLVALIGWVVAGRLLQPVRLLRETAQRISDTDLDQRITVTGHDDFSDLARTFNGMLDRLQVAFSAQRELLDDVGHELRTPITVVRGHIELVDPDDAREVAETRDLVLDELDRMNRLVDDLLVLAKARRPDFLRWGVVDVAPLVDDVLDKARALGRRRWLVDERADAAVPGDPQRLTQALLQLVANATRFTDEGDVVALGSSVDGSVVRIWVRDSGPGVPPEDRERVFDRFVRGSGARATDGSGLGLPIVAAIVEAHGGHVELDSEPGQGSTFTLVLAKAPSDPDEVDTTPLTLEETGR